MPNVNDWVWFDANGFRFPPVIDAVGKITALNVIEANSAVVYCPKDKTTYLRGYNEIEKLTDEEAMIYKLEEIA